MPDTGGIKYERKVTHFTEGLGPEESKMLTGQTPILVLKEGTRREKGRGALSNNIAAAKAINADIVAQFARYGVK